jgi:CBS domain-containing protein
MTSADHVQRVRIYLSRDDKWEGRPLYLAVMDRLRVAGATGATAIQGLAGFGPGQRIRAGTVERADQRQPVVIEWIDRSDRVARLLPLLDDMLGQALITREDVPIHRAILRASGPFAADRTVGDTMRSPAPCAPVDASLGAALALLIEHQIAALPIVGPDDDLVGLLTEQDLAWRAGLRLPAHLLGLLAPTERDTILAPLIGRSVREVMSAEPRSVSLSTSLPQAIVTMVEWGYAQVPVVDRNGHLAGIIGQEDVLRAAVEQAPAADDGVSPAEPQATVGLVMQTIAPQLGLGRPLALALDQVLAAPARRILITDAAGHLRGMIDLAGLLSGLASEERAALLTALQRTQPAPLAIGSDRPLDTLVSPAPPTLTPDVPIDRAARQLLELGTDSMPVVDADGRLLGIIARGGLIRALLQQSD